LKLDEKAYYENKKRATMTVALFLFYKILAGLIDWRMKSIATDFRKCKM